MDLRIKLMSKKAVLPVRASDGAAGYDLSAAIGEPLIIKAGESVIVATGIAISLPSNEYVAYIYARSGLAIKYGITLSNCVGVIDSDYRGEIKVGLVNQSNNDYTVEPSQRIAQMVISKVALPNLTLCDDLDDTERGHGGFGSTGSL